MREAIVEIREALGLNKAELADKLHCSPATVTRIENGERLPGPAIVGRLWAITPAGDLREMLAGAVLEAAGVPVEYDDRYWPAQGDEDA